MHFDPNSVIYQLLIIDLKETESAKYLKKEKSILILRIMRGLNCEKSSCILCE